MCVACAMPPTTCTSAAHCRSSAQRVENDDVSMVTAASRPLAARSRQRCSGDDADDAVACSARKVRRREKWSRLATALAGALVFVLGMLAQSFLASHPVQLGGLAARIQLAVKTQGLSSLRRKIVIIESLGGSDKTLDGWRRDTWPLVHEIRRLGWDAQVVKFYDGREAELFASISSTADAYISRVDPGEWINFSLDRYLAFLQKLLDANIAGFPTPREMHEFGSKRTLLQLDKLPFSAGDTVLYTNAAQLRSEFPRSLLTGKRVLKRSGGAMGHGIWLVELAEQCFNDTTHDVVVDGSSMLRAREASRNRSLRVPLRDFLAMCESKYLAEPSDYMIDMRFLPRIAEGEVRIIFIGSRPVRVIHRIPCRNCFSAGLDSGATHKVYGAFDGPFQSVVRLVESHVREIQRVLKMDALPLLWTADFILDDASRVGMTLSEINSNCIGFAAHPDFARLLAREAVERIVDKRRAEASAGGRADLRGIVAVAPSGMSDL
ncbi:hypothetical protein FVE85_6231 [Porphyridium purpureum]|uniref:DUF6815 domain-containing protein n=1 Tax=Porphyridium purpureum TaxID=35688 RepID=A0A5J4Z4P9_PORPP|nr:hypothetical protein FVE85_6231 [Porphyridium purpureum]|eukprot:POR7525..scf295_1